MAILLKLPILHIFYVTPLVAISGKWKVVFVTRIWTFGDLEMVATTIDSQDTVSKKREKMVIKYFEGAGSND